MFSQILLASTSYNKYVEYLPLVDKNFVSHLRFGPNCVEHLDVEETGTSYAQNALLKAEAWAKAIDYQMPVLADDSGIEVEALNWEPGIRSHRAPEDSGLDCNHWLLQKLENETNRRAKFVSTIALLIPAAGRTILVTGECWGNITRDIIGPTNFMYDPIFIPDRYDKTFAELGNTVKDKISHRGKAIQNLLDFYEHYVEW